jgi:poly(A) polymerase
LTHGSLLFHVLPSVTLVCFGSYRLGAHRPDSDLDVVAICPDTCSREDFFSSLPLLLEVTPAIYNIHTIPLAYTPVIKMTINDVYVDLLFGRVSDPSRLLEYQQGSLSPLLSSVDCILPKFYVVDDLDLVGMDEAGMRSVNGARVTQYIMDTVPDLQNFRIVLCAVKEVSTPRPFYYYVSH